MPTRTIVQSKVISKPITLRELIPVLVKLPQNTQLTFSVPYCARNALQITNLLRKRRPDILVEFECIEEKPFCILMKAEMLEELWSREIQEQSASKLTPSHRETVHNSDWQGGSINNLSVPRRQKQHESCYDQEHLEGFVFTPKEGIKTFVELLADLDYSIPNTTVSLAIDITQYSYVNIIIILIKYSESKPRIQYINGINIENLKTIYKNRIQCDLDMQKIWQLQEQNFAMLSDEEKKAIIIEHALMNNGPAKFDINYARIYHERIAADKRSFEKTVAVIEHSRQAPTATPRPNIPALIQEGVCIAIDFADLTYQQIQENIAERTATGVQFINGMNIEDINSLYATRNVESYHVFCKYIKHLSDIDVTDFAGYTDREKIQYLQCLRNNMHPRSTVWVNCGQDCDIFSKRIKKDAHSFASAVAAIQQARFLVSLFHTQQFNTQQSQINNRANTRTSYNSQSSCFRLNKP